MSDLEYFLTITGFVVGIIALFVLIVKRHVIISHIRTLLLIQRSDDQIASLNEYRRKEQRDRKIWGRGL